ncbi:MAG TPA: AAA family ATPase [Stellaceae bacterium]|jgi:SpoVK/Ycf46/Vps4 family AAA+-type ATPase|nr:AAA family ATPase [Stellaceae bacterium]
MVLRDIDVNLYDRARLQQQFGTFLRAPSDEAAGLVERELAGEGYERILRETARLIAHQWREHIQDSAVKGFLFHGPVGIGKTSMAKRLAYELAARFDRAPADAPGADPADEVVLVLVDGADIARGRYGDSEERLAELFDYAREGPGHSHRFGFGPGHAHAGETVRRTVLLFDDVESLFLTRSAAAAKEWHFSQNSVFFHNIDELDTAHTAVVLTTNRIDLLDEAITDRLMAYEFAAPGREVLIEVARARAAKQHLDEATLAALVERIRADEAIRSIRAVERLVTEAYVSAIAAKP